MKTILSLTFILVVSLFQEVNALNLSQIVTQVRRNINDTATSESLQKYTDETIAEYINEAQKEFVSSTWCLEKGLTTSLIPGIGYYNLPADYLGMRQVVFTDSSNKDYLLLQTSEKVLRQKNPDFENQTAERPIEFLIRSNPSSEYDLIFLYPTMGSSYSGSVSITYFNQPDELTTASAIPFDGSLSLYPYHILLSYRATAHIKSMEGKNSESVYFLNLFDRGVAQFNSKSGTLPNYSPSATAAPR